MRAAPIAARQSLEIARILHAERLVESQRVAQLRNIFGSRVLAQHLQHGIARHDVNQQKDHREDEPQRRQRVKRTAAGRVESFRFPRILGDRFRLRMRMREQPALPAVSAVEF